MKPSFHLALLYPPGVEYPVPSPKPLWETMGNEEQFHPAAKKGLFLVPSTSPNSKLHVITKCKLHL